MIGRIGRYGSDCGMPSQPSRHPATRQSSRAPSPQPLNNYRASVPARNAAPAPARRGVPAAGRRRWGAPAPSLPRPLGAPAGARPPAQPLLPQRACSPRLGAPAGTVVRWHQGSDAQGAGGGRWGAVRLEPQDRRRTAACPRWAARRENGTGWQWSLLIASRACTAPASSEGAVRWHLGAYARSSGGTHCGGTPCTGGALRCTGGGVRGRAAELVLPLALALCF